MKRCAHCQGRGYRVACCGGLELGNSMCCGVTEEYRCGFCNGFGVVPDPTPSRPAERHSQFSNKEKP